MITSQLARPVTLYRANTPRYAYMPLSGAGAAKGGGRFNRRGIEALYVSLELETAVAEYRQTSPLLPPLTLCSYIAELGPLVDVRRVAEGGWDALWQDWNTPWRHLVAEHIEPPSWVLGDLVRDAGHAGIIFPSTVRAGGTNVVLFLDSFGAADRIDVHDPLHTLPKDQSSWHS